MRVNCAIGDHAKGNDSYHSINQNNKFYTNISRLMIYLNFIVYRKYI